MATIITLPPNYGYVLLIALGITPVLSMAHGSITGSKRGPAKIPYPNAYASQQDMKVSKAAYEFNCAQRAHAQFLENSPQFMLSMLVAGLTYPTVTIALGSLWIVSRIMYGVGYIYGSREHGKDRLWGEGFWLAQAGLWGINCAQAWSML